MAKGKRWIVTTNTSRSLEEVVKDLRAAGLQSVKILETMGVVTGTAAAAAVQKLRKVHGVSDVSADAPVSVGPPDSRKTW
jgi:uncharacterized protein with ACT and thioredoxin-like domain